MFEKILKSNYNIETKSITQIEGGWSALAYIVEDFDNIKHAIYKNKEDIKKDKIFLFGKKSYFSIELC